MLRAREALYTAMVRADSEARLSEVLARGGPAVTHVAVFDHDRFCGIVPVNQVDASCSHRICVDLIPKAPPPQVPESALLSEVGRLLDSTGEEAVVVTGGEGQFVGLVTQPSLLKAFLEEHRQQLETSNRLLDTVRRVQSLFVVDAEPRVLFDELLVHLLRLSDSEYGFIGEVFVGEAGQPYLKIRALSNIAWNDERRAFYENNAPAGLDFFNLNNLIGAVITSGQPVISNNPATDARRGGLPPGHPTLRSYLGLPLYKGEQLVGAVGMANRPGGYDLHIAEYLQPLLSTFVTMVDAFWGAQHSRQSEQKFRSLLESAPDAMVISDKDGQIVRTNAQTQSLFGYAREELLGECVDLLLPERLRAAHVAQRAAYDKNPDLRLMGSGRDLLARHKDGHEFPVETSLSPLRTNEGLLISVAIRDVTQRKQAEQQLRDAQQETERLLASISSLLIGVDVAGRVTRWNSAAAAVFGVSERKAVGQPLWDCSAWMDQVVENRLGGPAAVAANTRLDHLRFLDRDGKERFLSFTANPVKDGTGDTVGCVLLGADVTERRLLEEQLRQANKLEAVGQLAAGIAHEINTPMQYLGDNLAFVENSIRQMAQMSEPQAFLPTVQAQGGASGTVDSVSAAVDNAEMKQLLEEMSEAITDSREGIVQVSRIVRAMKEFSHPGVEAKTSVDLNRAIETTLTVSRNEWKYIAEVVKMLDPELPSVLCVPGELNQVFLNLLVNASHTIADALGVNGDRKGVITVSTQRMGDSVEIRIADTGNGIPEAIRPRVFEPFFTTKEVGKGTGQGLALAHTIVVKKHGGRIWFESETGKGTTFFVRLPLHADEHQPDTASIGTGAVEALHFPLLHQVASV